jgi:hypothetical protein
MFTPDISIRLSLAFDKDSQNTAYYLGTISFQLQHVMNLFNVVAINVFGNPWDACIKFNPR